MSNIDNDISAETDELPPQNVNVPKSFQTIFSLIAILTFITGFIAIITVLLDRNQNGGLSSPHGLIIGLFLLIGGIILGVGVIILKNES